MRYHNNAAVRAAMAYFFVNFDQLSEALGIPRRTLLYRTKEELPKAEQERYIAAIERFATSRKAAMDASEQA